MWRSASPVAEKSQDEITLGIVRKAIRLDDFESAESFEKFWITRGEGLFWRDIPWVIKKTRDILQDKTKTSADKVEAIRQAVEDCKKPGLLCGSRSEELMLVFNQLDAWFSREYRPIGSELR